MSARNQLPKTRLHNGLAAERARRGWSQARTAEAAGVTRQSYSAIESGTSVPSTEVALRLSRAFGRTVEELFHLPDAPSERYRALWAGVGPAIAGAPVRLARVAGEWIAHAAGGSQWPAPPADGVIEQSRGATVTVRCLPDRPSPPDLVVAGCDPAFGIVADALRRERGIEVLWTSRGSRAALEALARGEVHVAGAHLDDPASGGGNAPWVREIIPFPCTRISFAVWEQCLLVRVGQGIHGAADLARGGLRLVNREEGSGSRMLLDAALEAAGVVPSSVAGYGTRASGHLAVAEAIASETADVGVAIRAAAVAHRLDWMVLREEAYELVIPDHFLDLPAVSALLDTLRRPGTRAQVEALSGYDGHAMGLPA